MSYFVTSVELPTSILAVETPLIYFTNPVASPVTLYGLILTGDLITKGDNVTFRMYQNPAISAPGTLLPIYTQLQGDAATSFMNVYSSPTVTSNGTIVKHFSVGTNSNSITVVLPTVGIIPGYSFLITAVGPVTSEIVALDTTWYEA
jgi:hypothetical protein